MNTHTRGVRILVLLLALSLALGSLPQHQAAAMPGAGQERPWFARWMQESTEGAAEEETPSTPPLPAQEETTEPMPPVDDAASEPAPLPAETASEPDPPADPIVSDPVPPAEEPPVEEPASEPAPPAPDSPAPAEEPAPVAATESADIVPDGEDEPAADPLDEAEPDAFEAAQVNTPPIANDDDVTAHQGTPTQIRLLDNDTDADGDDLDLVNRSAATNGSAFISSFGDGIVTYTANAGFVGTDTFTYVVTDGAATDTGTVTVTVTNTPPVANNDLVTTPRDTAILIRLLDNDTDADGNDLDLVSRSAATNGSVSINSFGEGTVNYTPGAGFVGTATFTYIMSDGAATDEATVTVTVTAVNAPPVANDDTATTLHGRPVTIPVLANDTGDSLTIDAVSAPTSNRADVVINPDGTVTYTPDPGLVLDPVSPTLRHAFLGPDSFTYTISDGTDTAVGTVNVTVTNTPPVAVDYAPATAPGVPLTTDLLANNVDPDGDPLLAFAGGVPVATGSVTTVEQAIIRYDPAPSFEGEVQVFYFIWDGAAISEAFVTICVGDCDGVGNAPPVAFDDAATTESGVSVTIDLLANDDDPDGDALTVTAVDATSAEGGAVVDHGDGTIAYTPPAGFTGADTFTYTISDGELTAEGTVTVTVNAAPLEPAPDPPAEPKEEPKDPEPKVEEPQQPAAKPAPQPSAAATTLPDTGTGSSVRNEGNKALLPLAMLLMVMMGIAVLRRRMA